MCAGAALAKAVFLTVARHAGYPPCNPLPNGNNGNGRPGLEVLYLLALSDYALSLKRLAVWEKHVLSAGMAAGARARLPGKRPAPVPAFTPHAAAAVKRVLPLLQVTYPRFVVVRFSCCPQRELCVLVASGRVGATLGQPGDAARCAERAQGRGTSVTSPCRGNVPYSVSSRNSLSPARLCHCRRLGPIRCNGRTIPPASCPRPPRPPTTVSLDVSSS